MNSDEIKGKIDQLPLSEKLTLVEDVWDAIAESNADLPIADWQKRELDRRYEAYKDGQLSLHDWEHVHKELRNKRA